MEVISQRTSSSTLNPNAPLFVPLAYRTVEDFSDEWWELVQSSPWFREYWLQERFQDPQKTPSFLIFTTLSSQTTSMLSSTITTLINMRKKREIFTRIWFQ
ncbi:hypothetical protein RGQ29_032656 [Quercus rubra]|uniref:Uncharacterized protein n=1 Tax=Quercus rubra TaxID=3512 RepID=A0AAN7DW64_QUERU|nr:hypothetical protein RGQ29_032656 [Quercus rubra]